MLFRSVLLKVSELTKVTALERKFSLFLSCSFVQLSCVEDEREFLEERDTNGGAHSIPSLGKIRERGT